MADLVLVGGGAFAREIIDWFGPGLAATGDRFAGYLTDGDQPMTGAGEGLPRLAAIDDYRAQPGQRLVMAIAGPADKAAVAERLARSGARFATLVHPLALVSGSARLGDGVIVSPFCAVSAGAVVGDLVTINAYSGVGHDVTVGALTTLSSHVDLTGRVSVGPLCLFGSGARVLPGVAVGERCTIGAGAVVVRKVADGSTLYAAPARKL